MKAWQPERRPDPKRDRAMLLQGIMIGLLLSLCLLCIAGVTVDVIIYRP